MRNGVVAVVVLALTLSGLAVDAESEWDRFRGPNGSGVIESGALPVTFGPETNVVWSTPLPPGHSSPILSGDAVVLTAFLDNRLLTISLDRQTGHERWRRAVRQGRVEALDSRNNPASPSPVVDAGGNVYVFFGDFGLVSYDADGAERWRVPLGPFNNVYGMGASPIIAQDLVILACDQQRDSFLIAVDGWDEGSKSLTLQLDVINVTDRFNVINFTGLFSGTALAPGRMVGVKLRTRF